MAKKFWLANSDNPYTRRFAFDTEGKALRAAMRRSFESCGTTGFIEKSAYDKAVDGLRKIKQGSCCYVCECHACTAQKTLMELGEL